MAKPKTKLILFPFLLIVYSLNPFVYGQEEFEKWLQKENEKFNKFIEEDDKKFVEFLKKEWIQIGLQREVPVYQKPKPLSLPVYNLN